MNQYKHLIYQYPELFKSESDSKSSLALFGVECEIGWFRIIQNVCRVIISDLDQPTSQVNFIKYDLKDVHAYMERKSLIGTISEEDCRKDLEQRLELAESNLEEVNNNLPKFLQIKEKFGSLRLYMSNSKYRELEMFAELMSSYTCEKCGNAGRTYHIGWNKTLCLDHAIENYGLKEVEEHNKIYIQDISDVEDMND